MLLERRDYSELQRDNVVRMNGILCSCGFGHFLRAFTDRSDTTKQKVRTSSPLRTGEEEGVGVACNSIMSDWR